MRVAFAVLNRTVRVLITHGGALKSASARMVQGVVNGAQKLARTVRPGTGGARRQMPKDKCALSWELLRAASVPNCGAHCCNVAPMHQLGGRPWVDVCREWLGGSCCHVPCGVEG